MLKQAEAVYVLNIHILFNSLLPGPQGGSETRVSIKVVQISLLTYCCKHRWGLEIRSSTENIIACRHLIFVKNPKVAFYELFV